VMRAVSQYAGYVRQACQSGADALVVGAGLALDLPELTAGHPKVALIPIVSEARAALHALGVDAERIPLIVAGGINSPQAASRWLRAGADGVQVGTPFAVTEEGDAHPNFKRVLAEARPEDIVVFMSVAGLPARAVRTPWLERYLEKEAVLARRAKKRRECTLAFDCLAQCGLRDGSPKMGQFCIDHHLAAALRGDVDHGLFFRGSEPVPFGAAIRPIRELIDYLLGRELRAAA
jgi:nitronate monooxygenase